MMAHIKAKTKRLGRIEAIVAPVNMNLMHVKK
jgi:hypothetical protein